MPRYYDEYPSTPGGRGPRVYSVSPTEGSFGGSSSYASAGPSGYGSSRYEYGYGPPPRQNYRAPSPEPTYTYDDEEPESIEIAPAEWNGYKSSATREELKKLFTDKGMSDRRVEKELDKEFAARAPTHRAGESQPGPSAYEAGSRSYRSANAGPYAYDSPPRSYSPPRSSRNRARSPSPPPRRHRSKSRSRPSGKEDDREAEIRYIMKEFGYDRAGAKEFMEWRKNRDKGASSTAYSNSPPTPPKSPRAEPAHPDGPDEKARTRSRMVRMFMEEEGYTRTQAEDAADRYLGPKPPVGSTPRRSTSTREKASSSSSSDRPYLREHAKAYRRREIPPEDWRKMWIKPHTTKGKTHDEATKLADKELYKAFAKLMLKRYTDRGLSAKEADKKLDRKFSKPPAENEY